MKRRTLPRVGAVVSLTLWAAGVAGHRARAAEEKTWHEPLLRAVSGDYRHALATRERLRAELATLPETPRNQQSGRIGFQAYRTGTAPTDFSGWVEVELPEETELDAVVLVPVDAPHRDFPGAGYGFPLRFRVEMFGADAESTIANYAEQALPNPGGLPVWIPADGARGRRVCQHSYRCA